VSKKFERENFISWGKKKKGGDRAFRVMRRANEGKCLGSALPRRKKNRKKKKKKERKIFSKAQEGHSQG